jgi:prepilin-type N-terminal cleavage/methylation domain-containing protein
MRVSKKKQKGFTLVELLVVVAILAVLAAILLPRFLGYTDKAREAQTMKDIRSMCTVVEAFTATDGNYPEASLDTDNPRSIASIMQSKGIKWTGDDNGVVDPWKNPYYYDLTDDYYCVASPGKDGILSTSDDICSIGQVSKRSSGLTNEAIPSASARKIDFKDYTKIKTAEELASIGVDPNYPLDGKYIVVADIDLSGYSDGRGWTPIGERDKVVTDDHEFTGIFDGGNYVISNLTINRSSDDQGLFGYINGAEIRNVKLVNININGGRYTGGLVGHSQRSLITDCSVTGNVSGGSHTGGLIGRCDNSEPTIVSGCSTAGSVSGGNYTGGLVGTTYGPISNSFATNTVEGSGQCTGGLVGQNYGGTISHCYSTGEVSNTGTRTGGLIGYNHNGAISNCYATGNVNSSDYAAGGLIGYDDQLISDGFVDNCYATGNITGTSSIGGLVGNSHRSIITNCYATGNITGTADIGGLIGSSGNSTNITNCYATGDVEGVNAIGGLVGYRWCGFINNCYALGSVNGENAVGGLIGNSHGNNTNCYAVGVVAGDTNTGGLIGLNYGTSTECYYNSETSGQSDDDGRGEPLTTAEMKNSVNFTNWDFDTVWGIDQGNSYPYLIGNKQIPHPGI